MILTLTICWKRHINRNWSAERRTSASEQNCVNGSRSHAQKDLAEHDQDNGHDDRRDGHRDGHRDRDRDRKRRSRDRDRKRSRSRDRGGRRDRERRGRSSSKSRDRRRRSRSRDRGGRRSRSRDRTYRRSKSRDRGNIPKPDPSTAALSPEEKDARTVFCMQLAARLRPRDLEQFFSSVGKVRDVRIITDNKTRRSKGIAYVEFMDSDSVPLAMGLNGQRLLGVPIIVQPSQAEKNRMAAANSASLEAQLSKTGPMRLYVGSLHFNITEDMLRGIFEPFGKIDHINLVMDNETGRSKGFGFITFHAAEDAKKALEQLNGFELAGRPMKVGHVTERQGLEGLAGGPGSVFDSDEMDRAGIDLGATGRLQLMAKLAEGTGFQIPSAAATALNIPGGGPAPPITVPGAPPPGFPSQPPPQSAPAPPIATQCFMLANMFDPSSETNPTWEIEIKDDVIEECNKHGGVLHIYVDKASPQGNVYVKCPSIAAALASVNSLHGRYFAGRVITAAYVPLPNYHQLFPDALRATQLLLPQNKSLAATAMALGGIPPPGMPNMNPFMQ